MTFAAVAPFAKSLSARDFPPLVFDLARARASGTLTVADGGDATHLVLRRGKLITADNRGDHRSTFEFLRSLCTEGALQVTFDPSSAPYPPGAAHRQFDLAMWSRQVIELELHSARAAEFAAFAGGCRWVARPDERLLPPVAILPEEWATVRALSSPRTVDELVQKARRSRPHLLRLLHFCQRVGIVTALEESPGTTPSPREPGLPRGGDRRSLKRAYRNLARTLHPDLHPNATPRERRRLERKLAELTRDYRRLTTQPPR